VVVQRCEVWWADLEEPRGSEPGFRRPVLIVQADSFNRSRLRTVLAVILTSNLRLLDAPGNVLIPRVESGLPKDSVANVTQVVTLDKDFLGERSGRLSAGLMARVDAGLKLVLDLEQRFAR
jgi:mRNA interferase MazF